LIERGVHPAVVERLGDSWRQAPARRSARIGRWRWPVGWASIPTGVVAACLARAREGLLGELWNLLCPVCRIPSEVKETLRTLKTTGRCEACNLDFELAFRQTVEMIFRAHPENSRRELATILHWRPATPARSRPGARGPAERVELGPGSR